MAQEDVNELMVRVQEEMLRHVPPTMMCPDCGRTFTDELSHPCLGYWPGSLGGFVTDERDPKRLAQGYSV